MAKALTVYDDKVQQAARSCPAAEATLKQLFPEAFGPQPGDRIKVEANRKNNTSYSIPPGSSIPNDVRAVGRYGTEQIVLQRRNGSSLDGSLYLNTAVFNFEIRRDDQGYDCLVVTAK